MNLLEQTKLWCQDLNIIPRKSFGQNFLITEKVLEEIIILANLKKTDIVLEIGPGLGVLTERLLEQAGRVIAVERDPKLYNFLKKRFAEKNNLELILSDALDWSPSTIGLEAGQYQIVANLPYAITAPFLTRFLTQMPAPSRMILMLQKEVADKLKTGAGEMSLLATLVQFYTQVKTAFKVSRGHFWPQPIVDSAVVDFKWQPLDKIENLQAVWPLVQTGFSSPRKKLKNNLSGRWPQEDWSGRWERLGWEDGRRAEDLNPQDWLDLWQTRK